MAYQFKNNFNGGLNLDLDELRIPPNAAVFIKNLTTNININAGTAGLSGSNQLVLTPFEGNAALDQTGMAAGTNYCCGFLSAEQTNEGYFPVWNSNGNHTVWVVRGDTGAVQKVHENTLLPFLLDPAHFYSEGRMTLELRSVIDPVTEEETNFKLLVFTNNNNNQCLIDVEASIATGSYSTTYFTSSAAFYNKLELIHLGSVLPIKCVKLNDPTPYTPVPDDQNKQNQLINSGWQFRIRTWDVWGRPSEWGIISSVYTSLIGGGCISTSNGLPRCVNLCFDAGSPLIKFITVAYRRGVGNDPSGQVETGWYEHETFRKYNDSTGVEWYNRPINPLFTTSGSGITFNAGTNILTYTFCADKGSNPVDPTEAARTEPGLARESGSVFSVNKAIGLANNVYDFEPVDQAVTDDIIFTIKTPDPSSGQVPCPAADLHTVVVFANLYNPYADFSPLIRIDEGVFSFGDGNNSLKISDETKCLPSDSRLGQVFADQVNPGFIAYLAGTPYKVIGEWGNYNAVTEVFTPNKTFSGAGFTDLKMTRFTFVDIPAGKYLVRLASHHTTINDANLQKTSTQVGGVTRINDAYIPGARLAGYCSNPLKEIEVDCSAKDVNLGGLQDPMFVIIDLNDGDGGATIGGNSKGIDGYLYESAGGSPIEMAPVYMHGSTLGAPLDAFGSFFTDHNGYYFMTTGGASSYAGVDLLYDFCDVRGLQTVFSMAAGCPHFMTHGDGTGTRDPDYFGNVGNWRNQVYAAKAGGVVTTFPDTARRVIKQKFTVCGQPSIGVPGIPVIMTKCQPSLTDSGGQAVIIAHNRYNYLTSIAPRVAPPHASDVPDYGSAPGNTDLLIFSQKGGCEWNVCGGCTTSMADVIVNYIACGGSSSGCTGRQPPRTLCLSNLSAQPNGVGIFGVQAGGKYPVAYWLHDVIGRHNSPQIRGGELGYVYVPNLNDTTPSPYPSMALCELQVTIGGGLNVDPVFTHITFLVGSNALFSDYFSWSADWVQYVDNTGVTNTTNPTAIRIYFQSLNEYNKQNNFGTNVAWDFITKSPGQLNDVVQFIMNGDGKFLPSIKGAPVTYDKFGAFFTVDYQPELAALQNGCLFRVIRPKQNTTGVDLPYYEQCLTLDINNGLLPAGAYTIPYQDSYLLSRSVPVPLMQGQPGPIPPGGTPPAPIKYTSSNIDTTLDTSGYAQNNVNNSNGVVIFQTIDAQTTFPFFFESPSPSDLWGSHLASHGRVGIPNPYEAQYRVGTEIAISNPLADKGIVNGIGVFLEVNRQIFDRNVFGDITVVIVEQGVCMVICNNDFFITRYNQSQLQILDNGQVVGQNPEGKLFTAPQTKVGSNYGVIPANINSIQRFNGSIVFLDNKGHLIFSNFSDAKPVEKDGYMAYLLNKISVTNIANLTPQTNGLTYWVGGIDPKNMEYVLTNFNIPADNVAPSYINTASDKLLVGNETYIFYLATGIFKSFASFTPEMYGRIPGYYLQRQFLSFKGGKPYIHHNNYANNIAPPPYCNFYGVQCEVRLTHIINGAKGELLPDKVKRFLYNEIYCRQSIPGAPGTMPSALFYSDRIVTEKGQVSRLLAGRFVQKDGTWCAEFLCDLNSPFDPNIAPETSTNALLDGNPLQGRWCLVSYTNQSGWTGTYFELSEIVSYTNFVEKSAE